eukprot:21064-Eustigmatos_ZCMA.PRE.1
MPSSTPAIPLTPLQLPPRIPHLNTIPTASQPVSEPQQSPPTPTQPTPPRIMETYIPTPQQPTPTPPPQPMDVS